MRSFLTIYIILSLARAYCGVLASVSVTREGEEWVRIPGGYVAHKSCFPPTSTENLLRPSSCVLKQEDIQIYAADVHAESKNDTTFRSLTANIVVPPEPSVKAGQVVYFWPGFKAKAPEMGYPVVQPVLQFGEYNNRWEAQSWFVDANSIFYPTKTAEAIAVSPGDHLTMWMELKDGMWTIGAIDRNTTESSILEISEKQAGNAVYNYALFVNENINVNKKCERMPPTEQIVFTNVTVNGVVQKSDFWTTRANCANNEECDCGNSASVDSPSGSVTLGWKSK